MSPRQLTGHSLAEFPLVVSSCPSCAQPPQVTNYRSVAGHGACSCGLLSEHFPTAMQRRAWHAGHKDEIRAQIAKDYLNSETG